MRTRNVVLPVSMIAAAGALAIWTLHDGRQAAPAEAGAKAPAAGPGGMAPFAQAGWRLGTTYSHRARVRMNVSPAPTPEATRIEVEGLWKTTVVRATDQQRDLQVSFEPSPPSGLDGYAAPAELAELRQTFIARYDGRGTARELIFDRPPSVNAMGILRELVTSYQVTLPADNAPQWTANELDPTGEAVVSYQRTDASTVQRRKTRYLRIGGLEGLKIPEARDVVPELKRSEGRYQIDSDGRIADAAVSYASAAKSHGHAFSIDMETTFRFLSKGTVAVARTVQAEPEPVTLSLGSKDFGPARRRSWERIVNGASAPQVLGELRAARDLKSSVAARHRLSALIKLDDANAVKVGEHIRAGKTESGVFAALGSAGTPAAQAVLLETALQGKKREEERMYALSALHSVHEPTAQTISDLENLAGSPGNLQGHAKLALGAAVKGWAKTQPGQARSKVQQLIAEYNPEAPVRDRMIILRALGNTAHPEAMDTLKRGLADPIVPVRAAALMAMQFIPLPEVDQILSSAIVAVAEHEDVRVAGMRAAESREFIKVGAALQTVVRSDPEGMIRAKATESLLSFMRANPGQPDILKLLEWVAQNDPEEELRANARQYLDEDKEAQAQRSGV